LTAYALVVDFDGTITTEDIGVQIISRFGLPGWDRGIEQFRKGEISSRQLHTSEARFLKASDLPEMIRFGVDKAIIRPGFRELIDYCARREIPMEIASSGWDFYVNAILEHEDLGGIPSTTSVVEFDDSERGKWGLARGSGYCEINGLCKCARVWVQKASGARTVFIGDGLSDFCTAAEADVIFARRSLARHCAENGIPFRELTDFFAVIEALKAQS
jgi:2,3-diketo-5-methylthio-1-phosphopentane phosphatase